MKQASVILVCENAEQLTGSGCCGKLEGDNACTDGRSLFAQSEQEKQRLGALYRAVRESFPAEQVEVVQVDPRNQFYFVAKLLRDVIRYRPGATDTLRTTFQAFALPAVILNGRVLSRRGVPPPPERLLDLIRQATRRAEPVPSPQSG